MSSTTLHSQSFRPARPLADGRAARGLADATTGLAALLRSASGAARSWRRLTRARAASDLRQRATARLTTDPSYAADLLAAAGAAERA